MDDNDYVLAFDHFYTNNHIQILKSIIPFISTQSAASLPVLIKYLELKHTISMMDQSRPGTQYNHTQNIHAGNMNSGNMPIGNNPIGNIENIYSAIRKYLAPNEDKSISQLVNAVSTMRNVQQMQAMMELLDLNPGELGNGGFDINEIMKLFGGNMNGN